MPKKQQFYLRVRQIQREYMVSVCDAELLGETICEGELELCVNERFYSGELTSLDKCLKEMDKATNLNLVGKSIVEAAVKNRMINELSIKWINCNKHGQVALAMLIK
ncbi:MAG: DUF424 family protein [Asgard group archaeon]|nr:DUF424 family protein [Asgard group archaeon]